jgi:hypothetical protein
MTEMTLAQRRRAAPKQIDNVSLPAGSPMYYYCRSCRHLVAELPEDWYRDPPPLFCDWCIEHGHAVLR